MPVDPLQVVRDIKRRLIDGGANAAELEDPDLQTLRNNPFATGIGLNPDTRAIARELRDGKWSRASDEADVSLQRKFIEEHEGLNLREALERTSSCIEGPGEPPCLVANVAGPTQELNPGTFAALESDLTLIDGVKPGQADDWKARGFHTISQLRQLPGMQFRAEQGLANLRIKDGVEAFAWMSARSGKHSSDSHLRWALLQPPETRIYLSAATLEVQGMAVAVSVGRYRQGTLEISTAIAPEQAAEDSILKWLAPQLESASAVLTWNGRTYDIPVLAERARACFLKWPKEVPCLDLVQYARRVFNLETNRLGHVHRAVTGQERSDDLHYGQVGKWYRKYTGEGLTGLAVGLVRHSEHNVRCLHDLTARIADHYAGI